MDILNQYTHHYSITAADMDNNYRMTPNAVLLYYQDCWARYMSNLHLAAFDIIKQNKIWVITQFNAWFDQATAFWSDEVEVTVWNSEVGTMRLFADFRITKKDGSLVAHGYGSWTLLDTEAHRIAPFASLTRPVPERKETTEPRKKIVFPASGEVMNELDHIVNSINLDFNGHVNNRTYLSIAVQTVSGQFLLNNRIAFFAIKWQHETFLGDRLHCTLMRVNEQAYLHTLNKSDGTCAAQIYTEAEPRTDWTQVADAVTRPDAD